MTDPTEGIRREMVAGINYEITTTMTPRATLEAIHGTEDVWDSSQLTEQFEVLGFLAPLVIVKRKADGVKGTMYFSHQPRLYFGFMPE